MANVSSNVEKLVALNKSRATHGRANSRVKGYADKTYGIWQAFRDRCNNPKRKDYHRYGGRGISYDDSWNNFVQFVADMGDCPLNMTLDRIDNNKGYSKENCRWATRKEQSHNSTKIRMIQLGGEIKPLADWLSQYHTSHTAFYQRVYAGKTVEDAIKIPLRVTKRQNK
jgi:hypothetical protein